MLLSEVSCLAVSDHGLHSFGKDMRLIAWLLILLVYEIYFLFQFSCQFLHLIHFCHLIIYLFWIAK